MDPLSPVRRWRGHDDRLHLTLEIAAVFTLGVLPHLLAAFTVWMVPSRSHSSEVEGYAAWSYTGIVNSLQILLPLLFIMWRTGLPWRVFGVVRISFSFDLVLSLLYVAVSWVCYYVVAFVLAWLAYLVPFLHSLFNILARPEAHMSTLHSDIKSEPDILFFVWMLINGLTEEFVTKAYLIPRLRTFFGGSAWPAVILSAAAFASYHVYQGSHAALILFFEQIVLGWAFIRVKRIWPFAFGHALWDIAIRAAAAG